MINKNAILRFEVINECLSSRRGYTIGQLVDAINERFRNTPGMEGITVKNRQVLYDMDDMKAIYGVEIRHEKDSDDRRKTVFCYPDGAKDIHGEKLLDSDYNDFSQAIWLLESLVGLPYVQKAAETLKKKLKTEKGDAPVFALETNKDLLNFDQLGNYFNNIRHNDPIKVTYKAGYEHTTTFWFQPYYLKQYNSRWFLFGWNYDYERKDGAKGAIQNLAIDRIEKKELSRSSFGVSHTYRPNDIDFEHYFDDIIGVTRIPCSKVEHITLKVNDGYDWNRLMTKPIHKSQVPDEGSRTVTIDVRPNPELYATLCQFEHVEVVSPQPVRDEHIARLKRILAQHGK